MAEEESESETITVGEVSAGEVAGAGVALPVVELLTGRGFVTGKSGSGKSNTASVVAEKLLDRGFPLLVVDIDGEYYGLKESYEILHAGADDECDIRVSAEHAEKLAQLALEGNVPIILDVSSFIDESKARELLTAVARHLFAKEKKLKKPFLLIVEEIHEYVPEGGGLDECGRMLVKVAKRGRKHGLGVTGISQRPADVKKDFITQCDWLCWHRLTWNNDTNVVRRVVGDEYAGAVEDLDDGEAFLMTDWTGEVRQVQFQRKRTFDAGATPGLEDFERPELKSVSDDLVGELEQISEARQARESRVKELERELAEKEQRIEELEAELAEARDLSDMAERFSRAMMEHATGRPFRTDVTGTGYQAELSELAVAAGEGASTGADAADPTDLDLPDPTAAAEPRHDDDPAMHAPDDAVDAAKEADRAGGAADESADESADDPVTTDGHAPVGREVVTDLRGTLADLDPVTRRMLTHYRVRGPSSPVDAHVAAGGEGDRSLAYSHNRELREAGLVAHAGRGQYGYALPALVAERHDDRLDGASLERALDAVEELLPDEAVLDGLAEPAGTRADQYR